jgi:hypothetical protein
MCGFCLMFELVLEEEWRRQSSWLVSWKIFWGIYGTQMLIILFLSFQEACLMEPSFNQCPLLPMRSLFS